ncbi:non-structural maintenance of chromosomes element 1 homolog isoform X1 [Micropterus dolomieu]|uniref:non-structural maintenance of chromosomes element 1 homolog isoform X1 n=1 Tax=Micropterus dolomieu TaxID=147949 RepID=UPI001E8E336D|nr:non-structural maintenance of chromosomes element 1 homolog isoform X1 [Micropterus dolomieu]XP_045902196.1 non-structural maintenance of chromosomes element 1 homolog isoform X1 [Micropterus dolomieu]XP_045902197.1 non-structural maintenance of chromosomes element 1 homolog isoform X1 [Micropterus dolomieu]XP_045902198.1 non-structural maintenance of chromosomes element 1 homolog isoform X1 [Micropterus dolomieu]
MTRQMGDSHRRFLQTMMASGIVDEQGAKTHYQYCCETCNTQHAPDKLDDFIETINSKLQPMFMQIRKGMSEDNGQQYYALVNMAETDVTRMSSDYTDNELELFGKTMDLIVGSENGKASSTDILNSADTLTTKKLKKSETEHLLNRLVHDKWLNEKRGEYTLSTRCIIEMEPYIRTMYQDQVKVCHICHNIAFQCQICENPTCGIKIHNPCVARYFKGRAEPRCPACDDFWPHEIPEVRRPHSQSRR